MTEVLGMCEKRHAHNWKWTTVATIPYLFFFKQGFQQSLTHRFADIRQGDPEREHDGKNDEECDLFAGVGRPGQAEGLVILFLSRLCGLL